MSKKVLITGATSMIGLAVVNEHLKNGDFVYALIRKNSKKVHRLPKNDNLKIIEVESSEYGQFTKNNPNISADVFFHFAWNGAGGEYRNDSLLQNQNLNEALDAVIMAKSIGVKKFIGAGSQAEYGSVLGEISEEMRPNPENAYATAKYAASQFIKHYCKNNNIHFNWTRIFSVYGEYDAPYTMISYCINTLLKGERPSLTKGEQLWDYIHVDDVANAFYLIGEKGVDGSVYNIGSGITRPLRDYIEVIRDEIDPKAALGIGEKSYSENQVMHLCADISSLENDTGFSPSINFEAGIKQVIGKYKK